MSSHIKINGKSKQLCVASRKLKRTLQSTLFESQNATLLALRFSQSLNVSKCNSSRVYTVLYTRRWVLCKPSFLWQNSNLSALLHVRWVKLQSTVESLAMVVNGPSTTTQMLSTCAWLLKNLKNSNLRLQSDVGTLVNNSKFCKLCTHVKRLVINLTAMIIQFGLKVRGLIDEKRRNV